LKADGAAITTAFSPSLAKLSRPNQLAKTSSPACVRNSAFTRRRRGSPAGSSTISAGAAALAGGPHEVTHTHILQAIMRRAGHHVRLASIISDVAGSLQTALFNAKTEN
jgi:hypothetical protein